MKRNLLIKNTLYSAFVAFAFLFINHLTPLSQVAAQTPPSPPEIVKRALPSVVVLVMKNAKDDSTQTGGGFFIGPDTIVTNFHVVDGANQGYAKIAGQTQQYRVVGTYGLDEANNLALVKIESPIGKSLVLASDDSSSVGDEVYAVGNPQGLEGAFSQGIIYGIRKSENIDLLQITAAISQGSSGGPVLNSRGEVLGVAVRYLKEEDLNFAIPVRLLRELIAKKQGGVGVTLPFPLSSPSPSSPSPSPSAAPTVRSSPSSPDAFALAARSVTEFEVNGLKVIVKRRVSSPTIAAGLFVRGGARNINEKNAGIEGLTLATAIDAGKSLPRQTVRRELASMGSAFGSSVSNDFSVVSFGSTRQNFDRAWEIYSEVLLNPAFADDDIKRNQERILVGLREAGTVPEGALEALQERIIYAGHPYANDVNGTIATIGSLTAADLRAYHKNIMETSRLLLVFVGDLDADQLKTKIAATFGKLPRGNYKDTPYPPLDFSKGTLDVAQRTLPTNYVQGTFAAPSLGTPDYNAMRVAMSILQTLVYQEVRGKLQLSYAPDADMNNFAANTANISVSTNDANKAIAVMRQQIKFLQDRALNEEVIDEISAFFLTRHYLGQETSGAQVGELARYELVGGGWRNSFEFLNGIRSVTARDVQNVANKYMKNLRFTYIGNTADIDRAVYMP